MAGQFNVVLAWDTSRVARDTAGLLNAATFQKKKKGGWLKWLSCKNVPNATGNKV